MIEESIHQEDVTTVNIYATKTGTPKYKKQIWTDLKGETDSTAITIGNFIPHFQKWTDRPDGKSIRKTGLEPNGPTDRVRTSHPTAAEYTFFSTPRTFSRTNHTLGHKQSESHDRSYIEEGWNHIKLSFPTTKVEISNRRTRGKFTNRWKLSSTLLSNQWVKYKTERKKNQRIF